MRQAHFLLVIFNYSKVNIMKSLSYSSPSTAFMVAFTLMKEGKQAKLYKEAGMWHVQQLKGE